MCSSSVDKYHLKMAAAKRKTRGFSSIADPDHGGNDVVPIRHKKPISESVGGVVGIYLETFWSTTRWSETTDTRALPFLKSAIRIFCVLIGQKEDARYQAARKVLVESVGTDELRHAYEVFKRDAPNGYRHAPAAVKLNFAEYLTWHVLAAHVLVYADAINVVSTIADALCNARDIDITDKNLSAFCCDIGSHGGLLNLTSKHSAEGKAESGSGEGGVPDSTYKSPAERRAAFCAIAAKQIKSLRDSGRGPEYEGISNSALRILCDTAPDECIIWMHQLRTFEGLSMKPETDMQPTVAAFLYEDPVARVNVTSDGFQRGVGELEYAWANNSLRTAICDATELAEAEDGNPNIDADTGLPRVIVDAMQNSRSRLNMYFPTGRFRGQWDPRTVFEVRGFSVAGRDTRKGTPMGMEIRAVAGAMEETPLSRFMNDLLAIGVTPVPAGGMRARLSKTSASAMPHELSDLIRDFVPPVVHGVLSARVLTCNGVPRMLLDDPRATGQSVRAIVTRVTAVPVPPSRQPVPPASHRLPTTVGMGARGAGSGHMDPNLYWY